MSLPYNYLAINLTQNCNTICKYCFQSALRETVDKLDFFTIKRVIDFLSSKSDESKKILHLTGGEPSLHKNFLDIIEYGLEKGYVIRIQSNGVDYRQLDYNRMKSLFSNPSLSIKITVDGWNAAIHEVYREKGTFDKICDNLNMLTEICNTVGIKTCVNAFNIHELYQMLDFCKQYKVQGFSYNLIREEGYAVNIQNKNNIRIDEIEIAKKLIPYFNKEEYQYLLNGCNLILYYFTDKPRIYYQRQFYLDNDGLIYPHQSSLTNETIGNVFESNFENQFDANKAREWGHYYEIDENLISYVKRNLQLIKKQ